MPMRTEHKDTFAPGLTKGGPGSGPHPGAGKRGTELTDKANAATRTANAIRSAAAGSEEAHRQAAEAHWKASDHYAKHEEAADEKGKLSQEHLHMSQLHQQVAEEHEARADSIWNGNRSGPKIQEAPNAPVYMGKSDSSDVRKGGPGSGPHPGSGHKDERPAVDAHRSDMAGEEPSPKPGGLKEIAAKYPAATAASHASGYASRAAQRVAGEGKLSDAKGHSHAAQMWDKAAEASRGASKEATDRGDHRSAEIYRSVTQGHEARAAWHRGIAATGKASRHPDSGGK